MVNEPSVSSHIEVLLYFIIKNIHLFISDKWCKLCCCLRYFGYETSVSIHVSVSIVNFVVIYVTLVYYTYNGAR